MIHENDWLTTNICDIDADQTIPRVIGEYVPGDFEESSFMDAAIKVANTIKNKYEHIFVAYSGGSDSEFCFNILHEAGANPTPIHVKSYFTEKQLADGMPNLKEKGVEPLIINCGIKSGKAFVDLYKELIVSKYPWVLGVHNVFQILLAAKEVKKHYPNGILVCGSLAFAGWEYHFCKPSISAFDQTIDLFKEGSSVLPLLYYNQHIVYETFKYIDETFKYMDDPRKNIYTTQDLQQGLYRRKNKIVKIQNSRDMTEKHINLFNNKLTKKIPVNSPTGFIKPMLLKQRGTNDVPKYMFDIWRNLKS